MDDDNTAENIDDLDIFGNDQDIISSMFAHDTPEQPGIELDGFSFPGDEKDFR